MSLFAAATAIGAAANDLCYGEVIGFEPRAAAQVVAAGPDPTRAACDLVGIYDAELAIAHAVGSGANTHDTVDVGATSAQVDFDLGQFASEADQPVKGDRLVLRERPGQPVLRISSARPDAFGRLICIVEPVRTAR